MSSNIPKSDKPTVATLHVEHSGRSDSGVHNIQSLIETTNPGHFPIFEGSSLRFGRGKANDIIVSDRDVSRFHLSFSASSSGLIVSDLGSTNGTMVNGKRISTPIDLRTGDIVSAGNIRIAIQLTNATDPDLEDEGCTRLAELQATEVTVMLVDVCGYTTMSQQLPQDQVAAMLRKWFEIVAPIITKHEGEIDKYIGDCVMALWRNPKADPGDLALAATKAAQEILEETAAMNNSPLWNYGDKFPWQCRGALNSGVALMGAIGAGVRRNYTVLGDTVNIAFRIESIASKLRKDIIVSQSTADYIDSAVSLERLGSFDLEGRAGEVMLYALSSNGS